MCVRKENEEQAEEEASADEARRNHPIFNSSLNIVMFNRGD